MPFDPDDPESFSPGAPGAPDPSTFTPPRGGTTQYGVAAAGFSILGGILKGMASIQSADFNARTARGNATIADEAAGDAILRGHLAAQAQLLKGSGLVAKQKTAYAASGVDVNSGSAVDVTNDTRNMSGLDAMIVENNVARDAWGYRTKADQFRQRAAIDEAEGRNAAGQSILGGITGAATFGTKTMLSIT